ncbi:MAG TPA: hypothetical protein VFW71_16220 [Actinomycetota bacterium]|nr:hypothetical protein [Actinomycetota bacterium]
MPGHSSQVPDTRRGVSVLLTCTDLDLGVVARMFVREDPWGLFLTCEGAAADRSTLQLLDSFHQLFGIAEVVVLHHTGCPAAQGDEAPTGLRLADTLSAIRACLRAQDPASVAGFIYDHAADRLTAWDPR